MYVHTYMVAAHACMVVRRGWKDVLPQLANQRELLPQKSTLDRLFQLFFAPSICEDPHIGCETALLLFAQTVCEFWLNLPPPRPTSSSGQSP